MNRQLSMLTMQELLDVRASLKLGQRDNFSPILTGILCLFPAAISIHKGETSWAIILSSMAIFNIAYFTWRGRHDEAIHRKARLALEDKRLH